MTKKRIALKIVRRVGICILTTVVLLLIGLLGVVRIMEFGPSKTARNLFVNSAMESSAGGILVTLFFSDEEIARIRAINSSNFKIKILNSYETVRIYFTNILKR